MNENNKADWENDANKLKYVHLRSANPAETYAKAVTIAYLWDKVLGEVYYTVAQCAPTDAFCKRIGRDITKGRYRKYGPSHVLYNIKNHTDLMENLDALWHPNYLSAHFELES